MKTLPAVALLVSIVIVAAVHAVGRGEGWLTNTFGGPIEDELCQVKSPDGRSVAVLFHKEKRGPALPGLEPPKTLERWARLKLLRNGKTVYDSGYDNLNISQYGASGALDVIWSPDSNHLAYRHIGSLRVIDRGGKATAYALGFKDTVISSLRWRDNDSLLIISKATKYGQPDLYTGYTDSANEIHITQLHLAKGRTERYHQALDKPTFLFHAIDFCVDEISPKADRVAFSDGANLCIYDDSAISLVAKVKIPQKPAPKPNLPANYPPDAAKVVAELMSRPAQLEGIWWPSNDKVLIGVALLGFGEKAFYTFEIRSKVWTDVTRILLPIWKGPEAHWQNIDWYRSAIK
jgi:hypothetical protein